MNKKGFTLMELLIVVIIIAGFAALAYPSYKSSIERARTSEAVNMLGTIQASQQKHYVNYEEYGQKFRDINDFEPAIANFNPNSDTFSTEYFKYTLFLSSRTVKAERISPQGNVISASKGYDLVAGYEDNFIKCNILNDSEEGEKICASLTDKEKPEGTNYYPVY